MSVLLLATTWLPLVVPLLADLPPDEELLLPLSLVAYEVAGSATDSLVDWKFQCFPVCRRMERMRTYSPCGTSLSITFEGEVSANSSPTLLAYFAPVFFYGTVYCRGFRREAGLPGEPY
jgi:hypothetical protein